jgi:hypothetical protein
MSGMIFFLNLNPIEANEFYIKWYWMASVVFIFRKPFLWIVDGKFWNDL